MGVDPKDRAESRKKNHATAWLKHFALRARVPAYGAREDGMYGLGCYKITRKSIVTIHSRLRTE